MNKNSHVEKLTNTTKENSKNFKFIRKYSAKPKRKNKDFQAISKYNNLNEFARKSFHKKIFSRGRKASNIVDKQLNQSISVEQTDINQEEGNLHTQLD